jgi:AcrR family transcriptional regulator
LPKVHQSHLDARRRQILDAARTRFTEHGFAGTSMSDIVTESGLSIGAIYRYFKSKEEIIRAVCAQSDLALPASLTAPALGDFLAQLRTLALRQGDAKLSLQIYAGAAISPPLAVFLLEQSSAARAAIAELVRAERPDRDPDAVAEAFIALCNGVNMQLAVRGDIDLGPFTNALVAIVGNAGPAE